MLSDTYELPYESGQMRAAVLGRGGITADEARDSISHWSCACILL